MDHADHFVAEKVDILVGAFVRAAVDGSLDLVGGPRGGGEDDGCTAVLVLT